MATLVNNYLFSLVSRPTTRRVTARHAPYGRQYRTPAYLAPASTASVIAPTFEVAEGLALSHFHEHGLLPNDDFATFRLFLQHYLGTQRCTTDQLNYLRISLRRRRELLDLARQPRLSNKQRTRRLLELRTALVGLGYSATDLPAEDDLRFGSPHFDTARTTLRQSVDTELKALRISLSPKVACVKRFPAQFPSDFVVPPQWHSNLVQAIDLDRRLTPLVNAAFPTGILPTPSGPATEDSTSLLTTPIDPLADSNLAFLFEEPASSASSPAASPAPATQPSTDV